jgi:hypothetical protein
MLMNDEKSVSDGTTYSLSAETFGTFQIVCIVKSVALVFFIFYYCMIFFVCHMLCISERLAV